MHKDDELRAQQADFSHVIKVDTHSTLLLIACFSVSVFQEVHYFHFDTLLCSSLSGCNDGEVFSEFYSRENGERTECRDLQERCRRGILSFQLTAG